MTDELFFLECKRLNDSPAKPTVPEVLSLVRYYCSNAEGLGGCLHILVEDGNVDDSHVKFCKESAIEKSDLKGRVLCDVLLSMSKTQRNEIYKRGYEPPFEDEPQQPPQPSMDWTSDSVRLLSNGERVKCMVIMDVTDLNEEQRKQFVNRALAALTRMGQKVLGRDRN